MDEESLVRLCSSAFLKEDIEAAKNLLFNSVSTRQKNKTRKGAGKSQRDLYDIISFFKQVDPELVPIFVAKELHKLPPVTFDHIDATRLLRDIVQVQSEIRNIKDTYATVKQLDEIKYELQNKTNL